MSIMLLNPYIIKPSLAQNPVYIPICTQYNSTTWFHLVNPDGSVYLSVNLGNFISSGMLQYFEYGNYFYVFPKIDVSSNFCYKIAKNGTVSSINFGQLFFFAHFSQITANKLVCCSAYQKQMFVFDMQTETLSSSAISANSATAQHHATLTFYDRTTAGAKNFSNVLEYTDGMPSDYSTYWIRGSFNDSNNTFTLQQGVYNSMNYSRNLGVPLSSNAGVITRFDTNLYSVLPSNTTISLKSMGMDVSSIVGRFVGCSNGTNHKIFGKSNTDTTIKVADPFATTISPVLCGFTIPDSVSVTFRQLNEAGYCAMLYQTASASNMFTLRIFNEATQISSTNLMLIANQTGYYYNTPASEYAGYLSGSNVN